MDEFDFEDKVVEALLGDRWMECLHDGRLFFWRKPIRIQQDGDMISVWLDQEPGTKLAEFTVAGDETPGQCKAMLYRELRRRALQGSVCVY